MKLSKTKEDLYNAYFLKEELAELCRKYNLPATGSKENLLENICNFIENRPVTKRTAKKNSNFVPSLDAIIDVNYRNNETHRAFFKSVIGEHFKFNVPLINWLNENKGEKTYREAIEIYNQIAADKKAGKKFSIGKQFEYNQYTRDFFRDNKGLTKEDCIKCWNYKKTQTGSHKYGKEDLKILKLI
ncbi:MAG: SAP domain-containing protein [Prevotellaceae bacterium]|jgi:hypothetical protein|nr:SAP domain-containing protein [Prevotellaceae bacterium]